MKKLEQGKTRNSLFGKVYISVGRAITDYKNKNYGARPVRAPSPPLVRVLTGVILVGSW